MLMNTLLTRPLTSAAAAREVRRDTALRRARTCYGHLAGVAGVDLLDALLARGWLVEAADGYRLTPAGEYALAARGVDLAAARASGRPLARACLDWTERRPHLAGALGTALLGALESSGAVRRQHGLRQVTLVQPLADWLGDG
jgi:hypothetical protein